MLSSSLPLLSARARSLQGWSRCTTQVSSERRALPSFKLFLRALIEQTECNMYIISNHVIPSLRTCQHCRILPVIIANLVIVQAPGKPVYEKLLGLTLLHRRKKELDRGVVGAGVSNTP
eukprot:752570-Hanusia_phi.AAC.6